MPDQKCVLVVDDDPAIAAGLQTHFERAGYAVLSASSGPAALSRLADGPDVIVLDLMLPGLDGYEVCRRVRTREHYVPIVMLTARDESQDKVRGLELGADAYMTKPFEPQELLATVKAVLRTLNVRTTAQTGPLVNGDLHLWPGEGRVERDGQPLNLTPMEFRLLEHLVRRPGQVFGRETLLREIWGYAFEGDTRTVDVHVQRLRSKLEPDPAQPVYIRTVRGFGYQLTTVDEGR